MRRARTYLVPFKALLESPGIVDFPEDGQRFWTSLSVGNYRRFRFIRALPKFGNGCFVTWLQTMPRLRKIH